MATGQTPITEAQVRSVIAAHATRYPNDCSDVGILTVAYGLGDAFQYYPPTPDKDSSASGDALWTDLRPSERDRLLEIIADAQVRASEKAYAILTDAMVAAALAFAAEFPDVPRPMIAG